MSSAHASHTSRPTMRAWHQHAPYRLGLGIHCMLGARLGWIPLVGAGIWQSACFAIVQVALVSALFAPKLMRAQDMQSCSSARLVCYATHAAYPHVQVSPSTYGRLCTCAKSLSCCMLCRGVYRRRYSCTLGLQSFRQNVSMYEGHDVCVWRTTRAYPIDIQIQTTFWTSSLAKTLGRSRSLQ